MRLLPAWYRYFAGWADKLAGESIPSDKPNFVAFTQRVPVGVVAAIVPWNSPLLLLTWKLAPALATGCTMVVKPSDHTPVTALELAKLVTEAGIPDGVFNVITGNGPAVGRALVRHPGVDKVAFTGSTKTGIDVAEGATSHLARVTLELGGKSAQIVFPDADLEAAANGVIAGVFAATGQTCMAGSRLIVHEDVHDELIERVAARAREIVLGNPLDAATEMGPLANEQQFAKVTGILEAALAPGRDRGLRRRPDPDLGGYFVQPTLLTDVDPDSPAVREEIFGPVVAAMTLHRRGRGRRARPTTPSTGSPARCGRSTCAARCGSPSGCAPAPCGSTPTASSDPTCPFGGFGASGIGRENGSTCCASTPRRARSGSRRRARRATRSRWADGLKGSVAVHRDLVSPLFIGREAELGTLTAALETAVAGTPTVVLLGGEAGVGKTRLVEEAAARARAAGARVLAGSCIELGGEGLPFGAARARVPRARCAIRRRRSSTRCSAPPARSSRASCPTSIPMPR